MASVVEELEFLIQMYKKASNKQKFLVVLKQLYGESDFSEQAYKIMNQIVVADQGGASAAPVATRTAPPRLVPKPTRRARAVDAGCSGGASRSGC